MAFEEHELSAADGHPIRVLHCSPSEATARGVVQIVHGMAEHAARYERFAEALVEGGWAVVAHDHRGHGPACKAEDVGHFGDTDGWGRVLDDVRAVRRFAREQHPDGPLALFGHSMGSFIATSEQLRAPGTADYLLLSGSNVGGGPLVRAGLAAAKVERLRQGKRGRSALLAFLSFGSFNRAFEPARTAYDWLSRDPDEVDKYVADPRCGFRCTDQLWVDLLEALGELGDVKRLARLPPELPVYIVSGDRDPVSEGGKGVRALANLLRDAGLARVDLRLHPGARHEVLNETNRDEITEDLVRWLDSTRPAR